MLLFSPSFSLSQKFSHLSNVNVNVCEKATQRVNENRKIIICFLVNNLKIWLSVICVVRECIYRMHHDITNAKNSDKCFDLYKVLKDSLRLQLFIPKGIKVTCTRKDGCGFIIVTIILFLTLVFRPITVLIWDTDLCWQCKESALETERRRVCKGVSISPDGPVC